MSMLLLSRLLLKQAASPAAGAAPSAAVAQAAAARARLPQWLTGTAVTSVATKDCSCSYHTTTSTSEAAATEASSPPDQQPQRPPHQPSLRSLRAKANLEYSRQRAAWRRQLGALRCQWLEEHQAAQRAKAEAKQRDVEERQQLALLRVSQKQRDKGQGQLLRDIRDAERQLEAVRLLFCWNSVWGGSAGVAYEDWAAAQQYAR